jgi:putative transposase
LTDGQGGPLAVVVAGANVHDTKLLAQTLEAIVVERPKPTRRRRQHLCLDKGYDHPTGKAAVAKHQYVPHLRHIGEERSKKRNRKYRPRRWVVERTLAWLAKCRAILVRYDKKPKNYLGLVQFACALIWYRRLASK